MNKLGKFRIKEKYLGRNCAKYNMTGKERITMLSICFLILIVLSTGFIGWIMNLENLYTYWPGFDSIATADVDFRFVLSLIGVFIFVIGAFTGFIW